MAIFEGFVEAIKLKTIPWGWMVISGIALFVFISKALLHLSWMAVGVLISLIGILISLFFNCLNLKKLNEEKQEERSRFLLQEIKQGFDNVIQELKDGGNDHIIWHKAVQELKTFRDLSDKLMEIHKSLYNVYFKQLRFDLYAILVLPEKPAFFYGVPSWENTTLDEAYNHSFSIRVTSYSLDKGFTRAPSAGQARYFRISPDYLRYLIRCADLSCCKITEHEFTHDESIGYVQQFPSAIKYLDDLNRRKVLIESK